MTKFYKFPDEGTYQAVKQDEVPVVVLGLVADGGTDPETELPTYHDGFHVNALAAVPEWEQYAVEPTSPWMIFA